MKRWLKYLLPLIAAAIFWNCKDDTLSSVSEESSSTQVICEAVTDAIISTSESEPCLPRQITYASSSQIHNSARRTTGSGRINIEFAKSGKVINSGLRYFIQRRSAIVQSPLTEPANKLLYLGKLII